MTFCFYCNAGGDGGDECDDSGCGGGVGDWAGVSWWYWWHIGGGSNMLVVVKNY